MSKLSKMLSKTDFRDFSGKWVAVKKCHVISANYNIKTVLDKTKKEPIDEVVILKVPKKNQIAVL